MNDAVIAIDQRGNAKTEKGNQKLNQGRLPSEFRSRTKAFASSVIRLFVALPKHREEVRVLGKQLLRSGTSVAAHIREASRARSDDEFVSKLGGALQEADESQLWIELLTMTGEFRMAHFKPCTVRLMN